MSGGVAANSELRKRMKEMGQERNAEIFMPSISLCTDNAAMIAWAGIERLRLGQCDSLDFAPRPRWPLDEDAPPVRGAGVKA